MVFFGKEIAVRGFNIHPDEHGLVGLENFVVCTDANGGQILRFVYCPSSNDCFLNNIVNRPNADVAIIKYGLKNFRDTSERCVADQNLSQHELVNPIFGNR